MLKARGVLVGLWIAASLATGGMAQSGNAAKQEAPDTPLFRLEVRRVPLDVVVTDKQGNPVKGLTKKDFIVKEDGKPQRVQTFEAEDGLATSYVPPKLPALPANTFINVPKTPERGPLYILYYDMVNTELSDQMLARKQLLSFIDHAPEGVRFALFVNAAGLHLIQGFTTDRELLKRAITNNKGPAPHVPQVFIYGNVYGHWDAMASLSNMSFLAEYLQGMDGRKNLIWMADHFPIPVSATLVGSGQIATASAAPQWYSVGANGGPEVLDLTDLLKENVERTYTALMRAQVAVYPLDLKGVTGGEATGAGADTILDHQNYDIIAASTGGRAFYGNNSATDLMLRAVKDGATYYSMTYAPSNTKFDDTKRNIEVQLVGKDPSQYQLRYRTYYFARSDHAVQKEHKKEPVQANFLKQKAQDTLFANIEHGAPMLHDLLFSAHVDTVGKPEMATEAQMRLLEDTPNYFKTRKHGQSPRKLKPVKLQKYVIDYGVIDPQLKAIAGQTNREPVLEFAAAAYDDRGTLLSGMLNRGVPTGQRADKKKGRALFHAIQELDVPPGATYIRLAVRDTLTDRTGAMEVKLPVGSQNDLAKMEQ